MYSIYVEKVIFYFLTEISMQPNNIVPHILAKQLMVLVIIYIYKYATMITSAH